MIAIFQTVTLENEPARRLVAGKPWFSERDCVGRIPRMPGIAQMLDKKGRFLAQAFCSPGSRYFLRVITREHCTIDQVFWRDRIRQAHERRRRLFEQTNAYRMVFSESDGMPSIVIDRFQDLMALQITSSGAETIKAELVEILQNEWQPRAIIEKHEIAARAAEGLPQSTSFLLGEQGSTEIFELDQRFHVDVLSGQKTGAYLDYRAFRIKAREFAHGRCLDAFCYQGWFSCHIASHAERVLAIDASADALAMVEQNAMRNGHCNIEPIRADAFEYVAALEGSFDFIHLDPPAMVKEHARIAAAQQGYRKLLAGALRVLNPNGILMVSSCSHKFSERLLEEVTLDVVRKAGRSGEVIWRGIQDIDHPVMKGVPELLYLKALALRV